MSARTLATLAASARFLIQAQASKHRGEGRSDYKTPAARRLYMRRYMRARAAKTSRAMG